MQNILGLIRHILTFGGGYAVANGMLDEASMNELIGGLMTIIGIVWSITNKNPNLLKKSAGKLPMLILPFVLVFSILPSGCVTGPNGTRTLDPNARILINQVARAASLVGLSAAAAQLPVLTPFVPSLAGGVNDIFATQNDPKVIGEELRMLFQTTAIQIGQAELDKLIMEYVAAELIEQIPAADPTGGEQFRYNQEIAKGFNL